jgi:hypothetical protein
MNDPIAPKFTACPECGSPIVRLGGGRTSLPERFDELPHLDDMPPTVLVGGGLSVEFERAAE